ncbi:MAG: 30S ribosomal protein S15 [bacterium]|nr:30S ribosomal protein S15 [bacterium]
MVMKKTQKKRLITKHQTHDSDTGSPQVQVGILTKEIAMLTKHLQDHKKDHSGRKGLLAKVARRRTLLNYMKMNKPADYQSMLEVNKLKK